MYIEDTQQCSEFIAGDHSILRKLLHPQRSRIPIPYSLAHATVKPGTKTLPHKLTTTEVYYILEGSGIMHINKESQEVHASQAIYIPPNSLQHIHNNGTTDLKFLCIVSPAWRKEDEEVFNPK